ncbi:ATPase, T2SS/T4P/T4SS family [Halomonas elongata]|uniref:ATPase, T2SS/T4P/T4SS family n=1 Tax=Halomonas elongata TaxID=2746 RepID=UPI00255AA806|nr:ATPase, T2SS/T4P/T4SS family [Halomonas elongata]MDL4860759.1 ATPase, T2SS/T4P/T4SS family [Halomonas elongata]
MLDMSFVDLYIGPEFCDIKPDVGVDSPRLSLLDDHPDECKELYHECKRQLEHWDNPEFTFRRDGKQFRATTIKDVEGRHIFILRKFRPIPEIAQTGVRAETLEYLLSSNLTGLVLVCGRQASGKTSTAASLLRERLRVHGGMAVAVEDPVETDLNGIHGNGRCMQIQASPSEGGYSTQVARALRTGSPQILIGEVRDPTSATQALHASINGHLVITTVHAGDISSAIERMITLASHELQNAKAVMADGLSAVIYQDMRVGRRGRPMVLSRSLIVTDKSIRHKIRTGEIEQIEQDLERQESQEAWQNG